MADGDSDRRHWTHLGPAVPDDGGKARVQKDNEEVLSRVDENIGKPLYDKNGNARTVQDHGPGGLTWQLRRLADGNVIRYRDSATDGKFWEWDPDGSKTEKWMVGNENAANIEALRTDLANHPENPYFRTLYPNSYVNASPGELNARKFLRDTFTNGPISQADNDQIRSADTTRRLAAKAEQLFTDLGGKENLNQIAQGWQNLKTQTDWDNWAKSGTPEQNAQRAKYLQLGTVIQQLKAAGIPVGTTGAESGKAAGAGGGDALTETMLLLSKGNPVGALLATAGKGVVDTFTNMANGNLMSDELRAELPALHDQLAKAIGQKGTALAGPGSRTFVPDETRKMINDAMDDNESHGLGPDDVSTRILPEYGTSDTKPAANKPAAATTTTTGVSADQERNIQSQLDQGLINAQEAQQMRDRITAAQAKADADAKAAAAKVPEPEKGTDAKVEPTPTKTPTPGGANGKAVSTIMPAPIGATTGAPSESGEEFAGKKSPVPGAYSGTPPGDHGVVTKQPVTSTDTTKTPAETASETPPNKAPAYTAPPYPASNVWQGDENTWEGLKALKKQLTVPPADIIAPNKPGATGDWGTIGDWWNKLFHHPATSPSASAEPVTSNVEVGAPLGAGDMPGVNRLHHQEHVDALRPGTPFYWRDHPHAYVRV
jgi:hypothetical protein